MPTDPREKGNPSPPRLHTRRSCGRGVEHTHRGPELLLHCERRQWATLRPFRVQREPPLRPARRREQSAIALGCELRGWRISEAAGVAIVQPASIAALTNTQALSGILVRSPGAPRCSRYGHRVVPDLGPALRLHRPSGRVRRRGVSFGRPVPNALRIPPERLHLRLQRRRTIEMWGGFATSTARVAASRSQARRCSKRSHS